MTAHGSFPDRWTPVTQNPDAVKPEHAALFDEGMCAAPAGYTNENVVQMLPRKPVVGQCRLCGNVGKLTKEHIPPAASGNKGRTIGHDFQAWLKREQSGALPAGPMRQGGIFGYTLCGTCNSTTGHLYGGKYRQWAKAGMQQIGVLPSATVLNREIGPLGMPVKFDGDLLPKVYPGAVVRQVLSCMCSLSGSWDLAGRYPELLRIVLDEVTDPMPSDLDLGFSLYLGPFARISGPQLAVDMAKGSWSWLMEIAFPPFAYLMVIASSQPDAGRGVMMNDWSQFSTSDRTELEADVEIGFGWTPYPGDYRTQAAVEAEAAK